MWYDCTTTIFKYVLLVFFCIKLIKCKEIEKDL
jgi:hypothetical protein